MKLGQWQVEIKVSYFPLNHPIPKTNPQVKRTSVFQCALSKNQSKTSTILIWHIKRKLIKLFAFKCLLIKAQGAVASLINVNHFKVTRWICATWRNTANNGAKKNLKPNYSWVASPAHRKTSSVLTYTRAGGAVPARERRDGSCTGVSPALKSLGGSLAELF